MIHPGKSTSNFINLQYISMAESNSAGFYLYIEFYKYSSGIGHAWEHWTIDPWDENQSDRIKEIAGKEKDEGT